jgi:hypothetical protein
VPESLFWERPDGGLNMVHSGLNALRTERATHAGRPRKEEESMRKFIWLWSAPVLALVLAGPAHAGTLATPSVFTGTGTDFVDCTAVNVGESPIASLTVRLFPRPGGAEGEEKTCVNVVPGDICFTAVDVPPFDVGHCKVIFTGSKRNVRGSISLGDLGSNVSVQLPATE